MIKALIDFITMWEWLYKHNLKGEYISQVDYFKKNDIKDIPFAECYLKRYIEKECHENKNHNPCQKYCPLNLGPSNNCVYDGSTNPGLILRWNFPPRPDGYSQAYYAKIIVLKAKVALINQYPSYKYESCFNMTRNEVLNDSNMVDNAIEIVKKIEEV